MGRLGIEIGPRTIRLALEEKGAWRTVEEAVGPDGLHAVLQRLRVTRGSVVRVALLPPLVGTRTVHASGDGLAQAIAELGEDAAITYITQSGLHQGDQLLAHTKRSEIRNIARQVIRAGLKLQAVMPWFASLSALAKLSAPELEGQPILYIDIRQGNQGFVAFDAKRGIELLVESSYGGIEGLVDALDAVISELGDRPVLVTSDDPTIYEQLAQATDGLITIHAPSDPLYGTFGLALAAAQGEIAANFFNDEIRAEVEPKRIPAGVLVPVVAALAISGLGFVMLNQQAQQLSSQIAYAQSKIRRYQPQAAKAQELQQKINQQKTAIQLLQTSLLRPPHWTEKLETLVQHLAPSVAASQLQLGRTEESARITAQLYAPNAETLLAALDQLQRAYKASATTLQRNEQAGQVLYATTVDLEVAP